MKYISILFKAVLLIVIYMVSCTQQSKPVTQVEPLLKTGNDRVIIMVPKFDSVNILGISTKYLNVPYGHISKSQYIDIYLPDTGRTPYPVIIAVHGGAFSMGNAKMKTDVSPMLEGLQHGYAVVSVNYRLSGEATFPRAVNDVKAVVRFIRANAKQYNFNPDKIAAWGGSAGGNLVAMLGTTGNVKNLNGDNTENLQYPSNVQAVVDWFGPCDFTKFDDQFKESGFKDHNSSIGDDSQESWYIGQNVLKDTAFTMKANPMTYIPALDVKSAPYFFIEHGTLDPVVPIQQSVNFSNALTSKLGVEKVKYEAIKDAHHFGPEFSSPENLQKVFSFLDKILK